MELKQKEELKGMKLGANHFRMRRHAYLHVCIVHETHQTFAVAKVYQGYIELESSTVEVLTCEADEMCSTI